MDRKWSGKGAIRRERHLLLTVLLTLVVASCGGEPEVTPGSSVASTTTSEASNEPDVTSEGGSEPTPSGLGEATVTLDGETFHYGETSFPALRCEPDVSGVFWVLLGQVDSSGNEIANGGTVHMVMVLEGTDTDEIGQVTEMMLDFPDREQGWIADPEEIDMSGLDPGTSQVDTFTVDGNSISGTATMFERNSWFAWSAGNADDYQVTTVEFEATCSEGQ